MSGAPRSDARSSGLRGIVILAGVVLALVTACLDFSTDPDEILFVSFERLPFPSIVLGDTLRDSTGVAAALEAQAVNAAGDVVATAPLRFYAIDDTADALEVDSVSGIVVAEQDAPRTVRIIATIGPLQTPALPLLVTKRPDSLAVEVANDTISYSFTDTTFNFSDALDVRVLHNDSTTFYSGVNGWLVRYTLESATDTVFAKLVDDQNRRFRPDPTGVQHLDTTSADGTAGRKLRIRPGPPLATPIDSVIVFAEARYRGAHIAGSPARIVVYVRPRVTQ